MNCSLVVTELSYGKSGQYYSMGPIYWHALPLMPAWISNNMHYKKWDEITYLFLNVNGYTIEV